MGWKRTCGAGAEECSPLLPGTPVDATSTARTRVRPRECRFVCTAPAPPPTSLESVISLCMTCARSGAKCIGAVVDGTAPWRRLVTSGVCASRLAGREPLRGREVGLTAAIRGGASLAERRSNGSGANDEDGSCCEGSGLKLLPSCHPGA